MSVASVPVSTADQMREVGRRLAGALRPGDLLVLAGELGAGKTTLTQGLGEGLGVRGPVTSPTFVIARVHPPQGGGTLPLVHVDAYRLGSIAEVEDLDLDATMAESVTVVEWGRGLVEELADDRLEVTIERTVGDVDLGGGDELRTIRVRSVGDRWQGVDLCELLGARLDV